jgi:alkanesulfonate monooxygenase SsuD/methylene tetrahydromethanopterin reductase-like flavin-dependent oxidoreductase (luciferase family)
VGRLRDLPAGRDVARDTGTIPLRHPPGTAVPIYVAASGPRMLELAGRGADGMIALRRATWS